MFGSIKIFLRLTLVPDWCLGSQTGAGDLAVLYHEVFHALGLEHPNDNKTVPFHDDKNSREYTVMAGEFLQDDATHYRVGET